MEHMDEPRIKYAVDPDTEMTVDAQAVFLIHKYYKCIRCGGRLIIRQGDIIIWHFKHAGDDQSTNCPLYKKSANENLIKEIQTTDEERDERNKSIPLIIQSNPYGISLSLFGILPTLDLENLNGSDIDSILTGLKINSSGLKHEPSAMLFRPSEPEARFELNTSANRYSIEIRSDKKIPELCGSWTSEALHDKDIFIGDEIRAKRVKKDKIKASEGDFIYIILKNKPEKLYHQCQLKRLDNWFVLIFELSQKTSFILQELTEIIWKNIHPFFVDIILPIYASPSAIEPITGDPNSNVLIGILPPAELDPEFEVVSVPLKSENTQVIHKTGINKPRWYKTTIPKNGSRKISIHLADFHRIVHMFAKENSSEVMGIVDKLKLERFIGLKNNNNNETISPWINGEINLKANSNYKKLIDLKILFEFPEGFHFDILATFIENSKINSKIIRRYDVTIIEFEREFYSWIRYGLKEIKFIFGSLGSTTIHFDPLEPWEKKLTIAELMDKLKNRGSIPRKINWTYIYSILGVPPGTRHKNIHSGMKKQFRKMKKELKKNEYK